MLSLIALLLTLAAEPPQAPTPATFITKGEHDAVLKEQIAKAVVDQPIKASDVKGGKASVAMLHRVKPEANALIHDHVTETYYILSGAGTIVTGGSLGDAKPYDLTRLERRHESAGNAAGRREPARRARATSSSFRRERRTASASWMGRSAISSIGLNRSKADTRIS